MKLPITKINEIDNIIYGYVYYAEKQLIEKYKKIHKEKFSKVLKELSVYLILRKYHNLIRVNPFGYHNINVFSHHILMYITFNRIYLRRIRSPTRFLNEISRIFPLEQPRIRFRNINLQQQQQQQQQEEELEEEEEKQEEQEQKGKKNNNINKYISISKVKYYKNINYRKKYKNPRKSYKPVGGKCVRFKYI